MSFRAERSGVEESVQKTVIPAKPVLSKVEGAGIHTSVADWVAPSNPGLSSSKACLGVVLPVKPASSVNF